MQDQLTAVTGKTQKPGNTARRRGRRRAQAARLGGIELAVKEVLDSRGGQVALVVLAAGLVVLSGFVEQLF